MVVLASGPTITYSRPRALARGYIKCSDINIIGPRPAYAAKARSVRRCARENIAADRVVKNLFIRVPGPPSVIVYQHHIADHTVCSQAKRRLD